MTAVAVHAGLDLPSLSPGHRLRPLLNTRLRPRRNAMASADTPHAHWNAEFFGLPRVGVYLQATEEQRARVLDRCGRTLLEEAYFIEKCGISFAAEMVLLAESIEERMLYAVFASEEARHFDVIRSFLTSVPEPGTANPFLALLTETIECGDRTALQFVIQVVLEGWGLSHYKALRDQCATPALYDCLDAILRDEAGHHGSGRVLFAEADVSGPTRGRIEEMVGAMLRMVQCGPMSVLGAIEQELGSLSRAKKIEVMEQLDGREHAQARLGKVRELVCFESVRPIVERLESKGLFRPLSPVEYT
jgi:hypothetical protein